MELYTQIGSGDDGGTQSYVDALARAKSLARTADAGAGSGVIPDHT
jgi:hypothetical protein